MAEDGGVSVGAEGMTVDGVRAKVTRIHLAGIVEIECAHCGTMEERNVEIDCFDEYPRVLLDEIAREGIEDAEAGRWKKTRVGVGRRSRNGGIVCPDCASRLEPETNGG